MRLILPETGEHVVVLPLRPRPDSPRTPNPAEAASWQAEALAHGLADGVTATATARTVANSAVGWPVHVVDALTTAGERRLHVFYTLMEYRCAVYARGPRGEAEYAAARPALLAVLLGGRPDWTADGEYVAICCGDRPAMTPRTLAERALGWVVANLDALAADSSAPRLAKKMAEVATAADILLEVSARGQPLCDDAVAERLLDETWRRLGEGSLLVDLLRDPRLAGLVGAYEPFCRRGRRNPALERVIIGLEMPELVRLTAAATLAAMGQAAPWSFDALAAATWAGRAGPPLPISDTDAYLTTHAVFYLSAWSRIPPPLLSYLRTNTPVWIRHYARIGHCDLLGEMIMVQHLIGDDCVPPADWAPLYAAQRPDGSVAHAGIDYHATLVALMAGARCACKHFREGSLAAASVL